MTAVGMNPPVCLGEEGVKVGVLLTTTADHTDWAVIGEGGKRLDYRAVKDEGAKSFSLDHAAVVDDIEILYQKLLQPLTEFISTGYNVALLLCGASSDEMVSLTDHSFIRKLLGSLFCCVKSKEKEELFISVSCLQFHSDGRDVDVLSLNKQALQLVKLPGLGCFVAGLCEVSVCSSEEAYTLYETCRKTMKNTAGCSFLFTVNMEKKLHSNELESDVCRSTLQLFNLAGAASKADLTRVNPLVKLLDQISKSAATFSFNLHQSLLKEALTGNSKTVLVYCIDPQGFADDETQCALELSQRIRALTPKASVGCWSRGAAEREIRERIRELRSGMMSQSGDESCVNRLTELTQNLQIVKNHSWKRRREESGKIKDNIRNLTSVNGDQLFPVGLLNNHTKADTIRLLQDQLRQEMEGHIREGKGNVEKVHGRIRRIQQLKESLWEETLKDGAATGKPPVSQQLDYNKAQQRRRQLKEDHGRILQEEVENMEKDLVKEQLPMEGLHRELLLLTRERQALVLQMESLRDEAQLAERDLQDQQLRHRAELQSLREESLQVFRVFRQASEEQRKVSESRYREVLLQAVQDAIFLSAQNQHLQADNKKLRKELGELKDAAIVSGEPKVDLRSTQQ